jgi:hypothetical protein
MFEITACVRLGGGDRGGAMGSLLGPPRGERQDRLGRDRDGGGRDRRSGGGGRSPDRRGGGMGGGGGGMNFNNNRGQSPPLNLNQPLGQLQLGNLPAVALGLNALASGLHHNNLLPQVVNSVLQMRPPQSLPILMVSLMHNVRKKYV